MHTAYWNDAYAKETSSMPTFLGPQNFWSHSQETQRRESSFFSSLCVHREPNLWGEKGEGKRSSVQKFSFLPSFLLRCRNLEGCTFGAPISLSLPLSLSFQQSSIVEGRNLYVGVQGRAAKIWGEKGGRTSQGSLEAPCTLKMEVKFEFYWRAFFQFYFLGGGRGIWCPLEQKEEEESTW